MTDDLYREICRCPEDDTLCLAYADWLDENGDPDRAEFVRVQYSLGVWVGRGHHRESALLAAHPEWSWLPCEKCGGKRWLVVDTGVDWPDVGDAKGGRLLRQESCPPCHGTGDLFLAPGVSGASLTPPPKPRAVTFARGFPDSVTCTLGEAFFSSGIPIPTPWACEVVRRTPVTRFALADRVPYWNGGGYCWYRAGRHRPSPEVSTSAVLPDAVFFLLAGDDSGKRWDPFKSPAAAVDALALAAGRLVRRHVYGEVMG